MPKYQLGVFAIFLYIFKKINIQMITHLLASSGFFIAYTALAFFPLSLLIITHQQEKFQIHKRNFNNNILIVDF